MPGRRRFVRRSRWTSIAVPVVLALLASGVPLSSASGASHRAVIVDASAAVAGPLQPARSPAPLATQNAWVNVSAMQVYAPPALVGASMVYDAADNFVLLFGGCSGAPCLPHSQTWTYSGGYWSNLSGGLVVAPPARSFASATYDSRDGYVLLFGGQGSGGTVLNDTWTFSGGSWTNRTNLSTPPLARWGASMAFDRLDNYVVFFGGCGATQCPFSDTWQFSNGVWRDDTGSVNNPPAARYGASFAYDSGATLAVLFGGCGAVCPMRDTWEFSRGQWNSISPSNPPPARAFAMFTYSGGENVSYLFGGNGTASPLSDTWKFGNSRWTNVTAGSGAPPSGRFSGASMESTMYWSTPGGRHIGYSMLFGGSNASCRNCSPGIRSDTWIFEPPETVVGSALPSLVEVGEPSTFSSVASGGSPPYVYRWQFGDGMGSAQQNPSNAYSAAGTYVANVTANDLAGVPALSSVTITVVPGPVVRLSFQPRVTDVGRPVSFSGSVSGGTAPYSTTWMFGDLTTSTGLATLHAYGMPSNYTVQLHASDGVQGSGDAFGGITILPLPEINAVPGSVTPTVGANVTFDASESGGTGPFTYLWTFGDGSAATSASAMHAFRAIGTIHVQARVTDAVGATSTENLTLVVQPAPPTDSSGPNLLGLPTAIVVGAAIAAVAAILAVVLVRRRRKPSAPLAAAPFGAPSWGPEEESSPPTPSRSARRRGEQFYRRSR